MYLFHYTTLKTIYFSTMNQSRMYFFWRLTLKLPHVRFHLKAESRYSPRESRKWIIFCSRAFLLSTNNLLNNFFGVSITTLDIPVWNKHIPLRLCLKLQFSCANGKYVLSALNIEYTISVRTHESAYFRCAVFYWWIFRCADKNVLFLYFFFGDMFYMFVENSFFLCLLGLLSHTKNMRWNNAALMKLFLDLGTPSVLSNS